jgi:hypothetical protein
VADNLLASRAGQEGTCRVGAYGVVCRFHAARHGGDKRCQALLIDGIVCACRHIKHQNSQALQDRLDIFAGVPAMRRLSAKTLQALALVCTSKEFMPNTVILNQGNDVEDFHFIVQGEVKLVRC